jgi:FolB domain-containing protein
VAHAPDGARSLKSGGWSSDNDILTPTHNLHVNGLSELATEMMAVANMDKVILKNMPFDVAVGLDQWRRPGKLQPVLITVQIQPLSGLEAAAARDDVNLTLDYGKLYKKVAASLRQAEPTAFTSAQALITHLADLMPECAVLEIELILPKAFPQRTGGLVYQFQTDKSQYRPGIPTLALTVKQLACTCIVGVNPPERIHKQTVYIDISVPILLAADALENMPTPAPTDIHDMVQVVQDRVEQASSYQTIEALASAVAQLVTMSYGYTLAKVRIEKPSAIATIEAAAVEITRSRTFFENKDFWKVKLP